MITKQRLAAGGLACAMAIGITVSAGPAAMGAGRAVGAGKMAAGVSHVVTGQGGGARYQARIVRTAYGIPHITANSFGSLGYGYGFAVATDDLCMLAQIYVTVEGERSYFFGPNESVQGAGGGTVTNLDSDIYWRSVLGRHVIARLLAARTGPGAIGPRVRQLMAGYVAGYNGYLASVGGAGGVPDPTCRGQAWVRPITTLDAYLTVYQIADLRGLSGTPDALAQAQPPAATAGAPSYSASASALSTLASSVAHAGPGTDGLPTASQLRKLRQQAPDTGSNAIAIGSAGTRDHQHGMLLGNPHILWTGPLRLYDVQLTIPGTVNVEGASLIGIPLVVIGFTGSAAWSLTTSYSWSSVPYQLTLVPGHPTEYVYNGKTVAMTPVKVAVPKKGGHGTIRHTVWFTRYGPVITHYQGPPLNWTKKAAFALADENSGLRILNQFAGIDEAQSAAQVLSSLEEFQGVPWNNTVAADATGHALYADIHPVPDVTNAEAARCDTAVGAVTFSEMNLPMLDGSRSSCQLGTGPGAPAPGIFGGSQEPTLMTRDFTENSNDSYWLANPEHPLTGFPLIFGDTGQRFGSHFLDQEFDLRTRSALTMIRQRIGGTDGLGPAGFTLADMKNLMYSDIQYGATLVKSQVVKMCRSFPGGMAPTGTGTTIPVGDSCKVLAAWNGRENPTSRGAVLFAFFWGRAVQEDPWSHPFQVSDPVHTPYGLNATSSAVQQAFGAALVTMTNAHLPYNIALGQVQYVLLDGHRFPMPGGPADPNGELNDMNISPPGAIPSVSSTYIQAVTWTASGCPQAATVMTYSESANPDSHHYDDQTRLFSHRQWVTAYFSPAQVAAHAISTTVVSSQN